LFSVNAAITVAGETAYETLLMQCSYAIGPRCVQQISPADPRASALRLVGNDTVCGAVASRGRTEVAVSRRVIQMPLSIFHS
jgi:hypothetical protein